MGVRTDLRAFTQPGVLGLAAALTVAAIAGKQLCSLGVTGRPGLDRLSIGIGMIPRGEVGLIFANIGMTLMIAGEPVVNQNVFSAVVVMVIATTRSRLRRSSGASSASTDESGMPRHEGS